MSSILKKIISISLLSLYLVFSVGITVSMHYCSGDLAALSLFENASCCCDDVNEGMPDDCCKDENKAFKITADQNKVEFSEKKFYAAFQFLPLNTPGVFSQLPVPAKLALSPVLLPRPPDEAVLIPAYKLNHSFLFYS